jgi:hypothetical protein
MWYAYQGGMAMIYILLLFLLSCTEVTETIVERGEDVPRRGEIPAPRVNFVSFDDFEADVLADLTGLLSVEQENARLIPLCDQLNAGTLNPEMIGGIVKGLNSISLENTPGEVEVIGKGACTIRIDQRDFGLDEVIGPRGNRWNIIEQDDPLKFESFTDRGLLIKQLTNTKRPWIHGTNFLETVMIQSYYEIMLIPQDEVVFQRQIGCDLQRDFDDFAEELFMAGMRNSLIALQKNRSILFTECDDGPVSITYDTILENVTSAGRNLSINPFPVEARTNNTFQDDASEYIFTLPNGYRGFALYAGGVREDFAPTNVVADNVRANINPEIQNARSCFSCHNQGYLEVDDFVADHVRGNPNFDADEIQKAQAYFGRNQAMKAAMRQANEDYFQLLRQGNIGVNSDGVNNLTDVIRQQMTARQVAGMLFMQEQEFLQKLQQSPNGVLAIGQLLNGGTINFQDLVQIAPTLIEDLNLFQEDLGQ